MNEQRLTRSSYDRRIAGVCGGLAAYFGISATGLRILWACAILFFGVGVLPYLILWLVLPESSSSTV